MTSGVELVVVETADDVAHAVAERLARAARAGGHMALTGGKTPEQAYVLAARLERFVETGIMTTSAGSEGYPRYHLTKKGLDFKPVIIALTEWGDRWSAPDGPPIVYEHEECGGRVRHNLYCKRCAESPRPQDVTARKTAVMEKIRRRSRS